MVPVLDLPAGSFYPFSVWTYGRLEIDFQYMTSGPFSDNRKRRQLADKLNELPGISMTDPSLTRRPPVPLSALVDPAARSAFLTAFDWALDEARKGQAT
jgi:hypothetical protein